MSQERQAVLALCCAAGGVVIVVRSIRWAWAAWEERQRRRQAERMYGTRYRTEERS